MAEPTYLIVRPLGRLGENARERLRKRLVVLKRVQFLPADPGVETFERAILETLFSPDEPNVLTFGYFQWNFEELSAPWRDQGCDADHLLECAIDAWENIHEMTQPTRCL